MKKAHRSRIFIAACLALSMTACESDKADTNSNEVEQMSISGKVTYRERIALAPGHSLKVTVSDVSIADRAAPVVAEISRKLVDEQIPLSFEIDVQNNQLSPHNQYNIRAVILDSDGNLAWTTDTVYLIDSALDHQDVGSLNLIRVSASVRQSNDNNSTLAGSSWQVEDVASGGIIDRSNLTLVFGENGMISGSSGCNQYNGGYAVNGNKLDVGKVAGTRMACPPALMDLEQKFLSILDDAREYSIDEQRGKLTITAADGQTLVATRTE